MYMCHCTYMATVTLYVKESDLDLVSKAKNDLGDSLSAVFVDCIRSRLRDSEDPQSGTMTKLSFLFRDSMTCRLTVTKSFVGRMLVEGMQGEPDDERTVDGARGWSTSSLFWVAQTRKNAIVCYRHYFWPKYGEESGPAGPPVMEIYDSFDAFANAKVEDEPSQETETGESRFKRDPERLYPSNVVAAVADRLNMPYEIELDI